MIHHVARNRRKTLPPFARIWAYPLWFGVRRSGSAAVVAEDIDWWLRCHDDAELLELDQYTQFTFLALAFPHFRTVVHYRLRSAPLSLRRVLRTLYPPDATLSIVADRIGPGLFIQHGFATVVNAESIGSHCWINQQVTIGYNTKGRPTLGDRVRVHAGAVVIGPITVHDGATVGANATVVHDVRPGTTVVAPVAVELDRRRDHADGPIQAPFSS